MNDKLIQLERLDGIYDINPPVTPGMSGLEIFILLAGFIVFLIFIIYYLWGIFFSSKGKVKRQIKQLKITYSDNEMNSHDAVYQLCSLLQQGLKLNHISTDIAFPEKLEPYKKEWHSFADDLSLLRYKSAQDNEHDINDLFDKSLFWLRVWP